MSFSNGSFDSYNTFMTSSSFTDLLNSSADDSSNLVAGAGVLGNGSLSVSRVPKFKSLPPPHIPISAPLVSSSSYFALPPGLSPNDLLDSPVLLSSSNLLSSPTTGAFAAQSLSWQSNTNIAVVNNNGNNDNSNNNKQDDVNKYSDFTFQTQTRPINSFQSSFPTEQVLRGDENQQQSWSFGDRNKQDDQSLNSIKTMVKSEFPTESYSQGNTVNYEQQPDQNSSFQPAQYIRDQKKSEDGYNWRKYGQKQVKGSENPRSYYKCTYPNCPMKKKIEKSLEGQITEIVYKGSHNHPKPVNTRRSSSNSGSSTSFQACMAQSNELYDHSLVQQRSSSGQMDSGATPDTSSISMADDEADMGSQSYRSRSADDDEPHAKRWRGEVENECMSAAPGSRAVREPRVVVQTTSDIDILDDGYRWRKYGQKVVKGNPNPRSYYKCTHPSCPVRKHVERASHDLRSVITTYEGKHNHDVPAARGSGMNRSSLGANNSGMSSMAIRPSAVNYLGLNPGNGRIFQDNQGTMGSSFEGAGPLSPFTIQLLQNPRNFGLSGYLNQPQYSENNSIFSNTSTTTSINTAIAKEEPKEDSLFESLLC